MRSWAESLSPNEVIVKLDLKNAYNRIDRNACLEGVQQKCPEILAWSNWCLGGPSDVVLGNHVIECQTGVQQGDPLAPMLFSMGLHGAVEAVDSVAGLRQLWYLDDSGLRGDVTPLPVLFGWRPGHPLRRFSSCAKPAEPAASSSYCRRPRLRQSRPNL